MYKKVAQYIFETKYINNKIIIEVLDVDEGRRPVLTITEKEIPKTIPELCNCLNRLFWRLR